MMTDKLTPVAITKLVSWMLKEYEQDGSILGIYSDQFFHPSETDSFRMMRYGQLMESPIGVAAGPHTQLSQNIIAAWLCGARYMELKTIQTLDELEIAKPCIDMTDEGYNCEWSQELKLRQSYDEYLNAWIAIHILRHRLDWGNGRDPGVIFNMSAGYNMSGILNANVQDFLDLMENCSSDLNRKLDELSSIYPEVSDLQIPSRISDSLTLSTMHGCPPDEIEKIGRYLIQERQYHTTVKLNPTLLGPTDLRRILHDELGFTDIDVPDEAFGHDLKFEDGLQLIRNLQASADAAGVDFSLKLTNTLEVKNTRDIFPTTEQMSYMSGRALHPISINVARRLQDAFDGQLDLSFSAGVDAFNITDVIRCNIKPVTTCTDILKPGGYTRLKQYLVNLSAAMKAAGAHDLDSFIQSATESDQSHVSGLQYLRGYAERVSRSEHYLQRSDHFENIKTLRELTPFDCIKAPCTEACATDQDVPKYMYHTARGEFDLALKVILDTNPMPGVTGYVCDHLCQLKCTRANMDNSLLIREIKRFAMERSKTPTESVAASQAPPVKIAVVGAGPSGMSCAYFLARVGCKVEIFEGREYIGGMVAGSIPVFRLPNQTFQEDLDILQELGIQIHLGVHIDADSFSQLQSDFDAVYLSIGAQANKKLRIPGEELAGVMEPLSFLTAVKQGEKMKVGKRIAIIGGGNTAIDAARTARRLAGDAAEVTILYRRTMKEMPADHDEIVDAVKEGITVTPLMAPMSIEEGNGHLQLTCQQMKLGEKDASGRRRPIPIKDSTHLLEFDTIIPAIGQDVVEDVLPLTDLQSVENSFLTQRENVFIGGDALRGASSVVNAIGDGQKAAAQILAALGEPSSAKAGHFPMKLSRSGYQSKLSTRQYGKSISEFVHHDQVNFNLISRTMTDEEAMQEAKRCLFCDDVCNICVSVCPNLANFSYSANAVRIPRYRIVLENGEINITVVDHFSLSQEPQIINIGDFCNECGNCTTFCPTAGRPFKDKPRFFLSREAFEAEPNGYFLAGNRLEGRRTSNTDQLVREDGTWFYSSDKAEIALDHKTLQVHKVTLSEGVIEMDTGRICEMISLYENLKNTQLNMAD